MSEIFDPQAETYHRTYGANLDRARREGLIIGPPEGCKYPTEGSLYSHLPWAIGSRHGVLFKDNARPLAKLAKTLITHRANHGNFRYLELGPGAGKSVYDVHKISKDAGVKVEIDTVSFDPIDPYSGLTMTVFEIREKLREALQGVSLSLTEQEQKFLNRSKVYETGDPSFDLDFLLHLQERFGIEIFEILKEPFVRRQYIGCYPTDVHLEHGRYDFIYEECGPLRYNEEIPVSQVYRPAYEALSEEGVMYFSPGALEPDTLSQFFLRDGDVAVGGIELDPTSCFGPDDWAEHKSVLYPRPFIVARRESCLARVLKPKLKTSWKIHGAFIPEDLPELIDENLSV